MNNDKNYSFFDLLSKWRIVIPQIQRDYAQGREDKNNEKKIISYEFILKIAKVLKDEAPALNLDFVYGYTGKNTEDEFVPLDGQQRLTTLWLLHWYLSPKKEVKQNDIDMMTVADEEKKWLKKFTYETRNSSKRFCEELIEESLPVSGDIYSAIIDSSWFMTAWLNDPTVVSMLNMLKAIQEQSFDKEKAWNNLVKNRKITFDYIDIKSDEFRLTDELYVKMNSRGRPLTSFENFKAQFSDILSAKETDFVNEKLVYEGEKVSYQDYFAFKIDSVWTDLFWSFVMQNEKKIAEKMEKNKKIEKNETPISYVCMNFFIYAAQMCYFKDYTDKKAEDFKNDFSVFQKKDNVIFLFEMLNFFYEISFDKTNDQVKIDNINIFFNKIFQIGIIDDSYQGQVRHFDDNEANLFEKCLLEGSYEDNQFENRNRIILYCLVSYCIKYKIKEVNENLTYYIRVIRNLLQATRYRSETVYETNVRINNFGNYWKLFNQLQEEPNVYKRLLENIDNNKTDITEKALNNEKEKAKIILDNTDSNQAVINTLFRLEEFEYFHGLIHQLKPKDNVGKLINYSKAVGEIWSKENNDLAIAALIACDFDGYEIKKVNGGQWATFTFGRHNTILTNDDDKVSNKISSSILKLLDIYLSLSNASASDKLKQIILEKQNTLEAVRDWRYYFLKYYDKILKKGSYFAKEKEDKKENNFEIERLGTEGSNPLVASHINPYIIAVILLLRNPEICEESECNGIYSYVSKLVLKNKFELTCEENGWHIKIPEGKTIPDKLRIRYNINGQNVFSETNEKDRIEIAVKFCEDLYVEDRD